MATGRLSSISPFKRAYTFGQMVLGALSGLAIFAASVYAFLDSYSTDAEVAEALRLHSVDVVKGDNPLPHNNRFTAIELRLQSLQESQAKDQEIVVMLKSTNVETMKILVRRIVADSEPKRALRMQRAATAESIFEHWIDHGQKPIEALRRAVRACGRGRNCQLPY